MQPTKRNYIHRRQEINSYFQLVLQHLFIRNYSGTKCNNSLVTRILLLAACSAISLFNACRNCENFNSHTLANALIKQLPRYIKLQKLINETLHSQLLKNFCKNAHRMDIDLVLIPYYGKEQYRVEEVEHSQAKKGRTHFLCLCNGLHHS